MSEEHPEEAKTVDTVSVLVVDDEEKVAQEIAAGLARGGFVSQCVYDGEAALEALEKTPFDVVLVDLVMPVMGGLDLLRLIRAKKIATVPVVLSAHGEVSSVVAAMRSGAFDYLEKPAERSQIQHAVDRAACFGRERERADRMTALANRWEAMFDAAPMPIVVCDLEGTIFMANQQACRRSGLAREEILGQSCRAFFCEGERDRDCCPLALGETAAASDWGERRIWGGIYQIRCEALADDAGVPWGVGCVAHDITERTRAAEEVREAHRESERLLSSTSLVLIGMDETGRILRWNSAAEARFGIPKSDAVGKNFADCGIAWDSLKILEEIGECRTSGEPVRLPEVHYTRADGEDAILALTVNALVDERGEANGFVLLGDDVTEQHRMEAELAQARRLEAIGQLAAGIAHEINTPTQYVGDNTRFLKDAFDDLIKALNAHVALAESVKSGRSDPALLQGIEDVAVDVDLSYLRQEIPNAIAQSLEGIERVTKIVRSMKEFSHPGSEEKASVDINHAIENTLTVARNEWKYHCEVETDLEPTLSAVHCLPGDMNQVFLNLIVNAAHAIADVVPKDSPEKGRIGISTRGDGEWVEVRIADTGTGIPETIRDKVFSPFFTTKAVGKGTGQGLSIARAIVVDKHGGTIRFETETGKGTTFIVRLPIHGETPQAEGGRGETDEG
ncbi:PAS domain S-box protein [Candidatus Sumerlaeota bacterium]|nr:PAS domain S-box protein [Candidatus Sumerlaeota bacterium]